MKSALLNIYELDIDRVMSEFRVLKFDEYNKEWLDFIVANRNGLKNGSNMTILKVE